MKSAITHIPGNHVLDRISIKGMDGERKEIHNITFLRGGRYKAVREELESLRSLLAVRDTFTWSHTRRVTRIAMKYAERLGLTEDEMRTLYLGAMLHDIGKIGIKDSILLKSSSLTEEEYSLIKCHTQLGAGLIGISPNLEPIKPIVLCHHERMDGKGYPMGLKGFQIPLLVRIVTIADAFEAMISDRPYRKAFTVHQALAEIERELGKQFDRDLGEGFIRMIKEVEMKVLV